MKRLIVLLFFVMATNAHAESNEPTSGGSGVVIGPHEILTANHVIDGCSSIRLDNGSATVIARDVKRDVAVLHIWWEMSRANTVSFHDGPFRIGEEVIVAGYPLHGIIASSLNLTTGNLSATAGYKNNPDEYTVTAPMQHGNSGGPLLDNSGNLVGIVTSQLKSEIAQNVNFATKFYVIRDFLKSNGINYQTADSSSAKITTVEVGEKAKLFTVSVYCYGEPETADAPPPSSSQPPSNRPSVGYWSTTVSENSCILTSDFTDGRAPLGLTRDFGLMALITARLAHCKNAGQEAIVVHSRFAWICQSAVANIRVAASVQIDSYAPLSGPGRAFPDFPNAIAIQVHPRFYNALIYEMIEGWWGNCKIYRQ
jgi:Trypsin-like peptidase domain